MMWHVRDIGDNQAVGPTDFAKSFVLDPVFSGVTRNGTHLDILDFYYRVLGPNGKKGERLICSSDLPRFSAILRQLFPKKGFLSFYNFHRPVALLATTLEWFWLIRIFGEKHHGKIVLKESAHRDLVLGNRPNRTLNTKCRLVHIFPAIWSMFKGLFVRLDPDVKDEIVEIRKQVQACPIRGMQPGNQDAEEKD